MGKSLYDDSVWADDPRDIIRLQRGKRSMFADANSTYGWNGTGAGQTAQNGLYTDPYTGAQGPTSGYSGTSASPGSLGGASGSTYDPYQGQAPPTPAAMQNDPGLGTSGDVNPYTEGSPVAANPYAFQYGNTVQDPEAAGWVNQENAMATGGANISNQNSMSANAGQDRATTAGAMTGESGLTGALGTNANQLAGTASGLQNTANSLTSLGQFEGGVANGTGPNLAQAQLNSATNQGIAAQYALANSAPGSLAAAGAARNAATQGIAAQQSANQQSAANTIQQQYNAAQAAAGAYGAAGGALAQQTGAYGQQASSLSQAGNLYGQIGSQAAGQTTADNQAAQTQAALNLQAAQANQQTGYNYAGLTQNVLQNSLTGQEAGQNNKLGLSALNQQANQANTQNVLGAVGTGAAVAGTVVGAALKAPDADLQEPGGTAAWTLREESGGPGHDPFILALDRQGGRVLKLATQPLTASEHRQAMAPHGAGPLGQDDPNRMRAVSNDMPLMGGQGAQMQGGTPQRWAQMQPAQAARPAVPPGQMFAPRPVQQYADLDLHGGRYADVNMGPYGDPAALQAAYGFANPGSQPAPVPSQTTQNAQIMGNSAALSSAAAADPPISDTDLTSSGLPPNPPVPSGPDNKDPKSLITMPKPASAAPATGAGTVPTGAGGGPARFVPLVPQGTLDDIKAGEYDQNAAMMRGTAADKAQLRQQGEDAAQRAQLMREDDAKQQAAMEADQLHTQQQEQRRDLLSQDAAKAGRDAGWHPSTGFRIQSAIALGLGRLGAGLTHGQNAVAPIINETINRELDRQKQEIESKKGRVADMDSALARAYRRTGDMQQAMAVTRSIKLQEADTDAQEHAAQSGLPSVQAKADQLSAALRIQRAEEDAKYYGRAMPSGAGSALGERYKAYVYGELSKPGGKALGFPEFQRAMGGAGGESVARAPGGAGLNQKAAALDAALDHGTGADGKPLPGPHGMDWYDRNAWDFMRSAESLRNERDIATEARAASAVVGRPPPLTISPAEVNDAVIGRPDDASLSAFEAQAKRNADRLRYTKDTTPAGEKDEP